MTVLLLSAYPEKIIDTIKATDFVLTTSEVISLDFLQQEKVDFIVSYGYRHILKEPIISVFKTRIVNLHISYLPWNRGADPNFWAWYEGTPSGVSIHYIDEGIDTGPILMQDQVEFPLGQTLASSYAILQKRLEELFFQNWAEIRSGSILARAQSGKGTYHARKDMREIIHKFPLGHATSVETVMKMGEKKLLER